jgi:hypothetical protein
MSLFIAAALILVLVSTITGFTPRNVPYVPFASSRGASRFRMEIKLAPTVDSPLSAEVTYHGLSISGFTSKKTNIAEPFVFLKLFEKEKWDSITAVTDDLPFTRKRLTTPETVYSGLIDALKYHCISDDNNLEAGIKGNEAWIAFNVSSAELPAMADIAINNGVKRVVFATPVLSDGMGADVTFAGPCEKMTSAGIDYTILKFGADSVTRMGEAKFPYRIVRGEAAIPVGGEVLSSDDLMRIIAEVVDLPKTFNCVYGIGAGSNVDREILTYMKSQGWPERVQIGLLCGDFMEKAEEAYERIQGGLR